MKRLLAVLVLVVGIPLAAMADQITLGNFCSSGGPLDVASGSPPVVNGSTITGCNATFESGQGNISGLTYDLGASSLSVSGSGNSLTGSISWLWDSGLSPNDTLTLAGQLTVISASGFYGEYVVGGIYNIDVTLQGCTVVQETLSCTGASGGEVPVPEPATLTLLGTGLLGLAGVVRRKLRAK